MHVYIRSFLETKVYPQFPSPPYIFKAKLLRLLTLLYQFLPPKYCFSSVQFSSVQFSRSVVSDSLQPHEQQYTRPPSQSFQPWFYGSNFLLDKPCISFNVLQVLKTPISSCNNTYAYAFISHFQQRSSVTSGVMKPQGSEQKVRNLLFTFEIEYLQHLTEQFIIWEIKINSVKKQGIHSFRFVAQTDQEFQRRIKILDIGGVVRGMWYTTI